MCDNCRSKQGPFNRTLVSGKTLCVKNRQAEGWMAKVRECNARRAKIDSNNE